MDLDFSSLIRALLDKLDVIVFALRHGAYYHSEVLTIWTEGVLIIPSKGLRATPRRADTIDLSDVIECGVRGAGGRGNGDGLLLRPRHKGHQSKGLLAGTDVVSEHIATVNPHDIWAAPLPLGLAYRPPRGVRALETFAAGALPRGYAKHTRLAFAGAHGSGRRWCRLRVRVEAVSESGNRV